MTTTARCLSVAILLTVTSPGSLSRTTDMRDARAHHTMTLLPDGHVFIAGGFAGSGHEGSPYRTTELFDPATDRFTAGPAMRQGRSGHTATLLDDGRVLLAGGWPDAGGTFGSAEIDDPSGRREADAVVLQVPRAGHTATVLGDGRVLLVGGVDRSGDALASAELFDPRTRTVTRAGSMGVARAAHTATLLDDGRVAIVGGSNGRRRTTSVTRAIEVYDPRTNRFAPAGTLRLPRHKHATALLPGGRLLVVGGSDARDWQGRYDSSEIVDLASGTSHDAPSMQQPRFKIGDAVVQLAPDRVLIAGGGSSAEIYDATASRFYRTSGSYGASLFLAAAVTLRDGRVLITGGYTDAPTLPARRLAYLFVPR